MRSCRSEAVDGSIRTFVENQSFGRIVLNRGKGIKRKLSGLKLGRRDFFVLNLRAGLNQAFPLRPQISRAAPPEVTNPPRIPSRNQTRICHLDRSVIAQQHVTRMEVAMCQRSFFSVMQDLEDLF
jgi:hypothetical protein